MNSLQAGTVAKRKGGKGRCTERGVREGGGRVSLNEGTAVESSGAKGPAQTGPPPHRPARKKPGPENPQCCWG